MIVLFQLLIYTGKHFFNFIITKFNEKSTINDEEKPLKTTSSKISSLYEGEAPQYQAFINGGGELRFSPPLYCQRYLAVQDLIINDEIWHNQLHKIVDFGCAELSFFKYTKNIRGVHEIFEVDIESNLIELNANKVQPFTAEYLNPRSEPLKVSLFVGSISDPDRRLIGTDVVIGIEIIEHLYPDHLEAVPYNIFEFIRPKLAVFTTPNAEFNILFHKDVSKMRHLDHKFEWTREQFQDWAENITVRFPNYKVSFFGIGALPADILENLGCCTQMAVFHRINEFVEDRSDTCSYTSYGICTYQSVNQDHFNDLSSRDGNEYYKLINEIEFPFEYVNEKDLADQICDEIKYRLSMYGAEYGLYFNYNQWRSEIPVTFLYKFVKELCSLDKFICLLRERHYGLENCLIDDAIHLCVVCEAQEVCDTEDNEMDNNDYDDIEENKYVPFSADSGSEWETVKWESSAVSAFTVATNESNLPLTPDGNQVYDNVVDDCWNDFNINFTLNNDKIEVADTDMIVPMKISIEGVNKINLNDEATLYVPKDSMHSLHESLLSSSTTITNQKNKENELYGNQDTEMDKNKLTSSDNSNQKVYGQTTQCLSSSLQSNQCFDKNQVGNEIESNSLLSLVTASIKSYDDNMLDQSITSPQSIIKDSSKRTLSENFEEKCSSRSNEHSEILKNDKRRHEVYSLDHVKKDPLISSNNSVGASQIILNQSLENFETNLDNSDKLEKSTKNKHIIETKNSSEIIDDKELKLKMNTNLDLRTVPEINNETQLKNFDLKDKTNILHLPLKIPMKTQDSINLISNCKSRTYNKCITCKKCNEIPEVDAILVQTSSRNDLKIQDENSLQPFNQLNESSSDRTIAKTLEENNLSTNCKSIITVEEPIYENIILNNEIFNEKNCLDSSSRNSIKTEDSENLNKSLENCKFISSDQLQVIQNKQNSTLRKTDKMSTIKHDEDFTNSEVPTKTIKSLQIAELDKNEREQIISLESPNIISSIIESEKTVVNSKSDLDSFLKVIPNIKREKSDLVGDKTDVFVKLSSKISIETEEKNNISEFNNLLNDRSISTEIETQKISAKISIGNVENCCRDSMKLSEKTDIFKEITSSIGEEEAEIKIAKDQSERELRLDKKSKSDLEQFLDHLMIEGRIEEIIVNEANDNEVEAPGRAVGEVHNVDDHNDGVIQDNQENNEIEERPWEVAGLAHNIVGGIVENGDLINNNRDIEGNNYEGVQNFVEDEVNDDIEDVVDANANFNDDHNDIELDEEVIELPAAANVLDYIVGCANNEKELLPEILQNQTIIPPQKINLPDEEEDAVPSRKYEELSSSSLDVNTSSIDIANSVSESCSVSTRRRGNVLESESNSFPNLLIPPEPFPEWLAQLMPLPSTTSSAPGDFLSQGDNLNVNPAPSIANEDFDNSSGSEESHRQGEDHVSDEGLAMDLIENNLEPESSQNSLVNIETIEGDELYYDTINDLEREETIPSKVSARTASEEYLLAKDVAGSSEEEI